MNAQLNWFFWLFAIFYFIHFLVEMALDGLNLKEIKKHRSQVPELFRDSFSFEDYQKSIDYTRAKTRFAWVQTIFDMVILWALILSGGFYFFDDWLAPLFSEGSVARLVAYPFLVGGIFFVLHLPFEIYHQFVLEERFGFNRMQWSTFIMDKIKSMLIGLVLGVPLLLLIFKTVTWLGALWWLGAWGVMMLFQFGIAALFPVLLAPLFYKFTPLEESPLKEKIHTLAKKIHFKMAGVFTIDGSKRSSHSNAFFAGMGKARRIVLFDTLVKNLSESEIISVLAHEMGHNVKNHILKSTLLSSLVSLLGFWALSLLLKWPLFFQAFGVPQPNLAIGFVLFSLFMGVFTFPLNPLFKWISRKHEYEADRFSVATTDDPKNMASSLVKLSKDNLSNLTPHPWYSFYHYSHPTTQERVRAIFAK